MTIEINVHTEPDFREWKTLVARACRAALSQGDLDQGALTVVLTDNETVRQMNKEYAEEDRTTDVLAFPSGDHDPDSDMPYLGDILIAVPVAKTQADERGHDLGTELSLLTIHGTLHLLGHDHHDAHSKDRMWALQNSALLSMGISNASLSGNQ